MSDLYFRVLGDLEVVRDGRPVPVPRGKLQVLLASLIVRSNSVAPFDEIAGRLWEDKAPTVARATVQAYAMRLRQALSDDRQHPSLILTKANGYLLRVDPDQVDFLRFGRLVEQAKQAADPALESTVLAEALGLWRGQVLAGVPSDSLQQEFVPHLLEARLRALECRVDADLRLNRHRDLVSELSGLTREHPLRERFWAQLMTALNRSDRRAEALEAYRSMAQLYREELGIAPSAPLQDLYQKMLRAPFADRSNLSGDVAVTPDNGGLRGLRVPAETVTLHGRKEVERDLVAVLTPGPECRTAPLAVVSGPAGVGKTALAVRVAHAVSPQFPDGQLFVDLRGDSVAEPLSVTEVLGKLVRACGVPAERVPTDPEDLVGLYRGVLAHRRVLVVLDSVCSVGQAWPLLPGAPGCAVLITSRSDLRGLAVRHTAHRVRLPPLNPPAASAVLADLLGRPALLAEPAAAAELARQCGGLPLALRIAAVRLLELPGRSVAAYLRRLRARGRLRELVAESRPGIGIRSAIEPSYRRLSPAERQMFRLLAASLPDEFEESTVIASWRGSPDEALSLLDGLVSANLLTWCAPGRYGFHDLIREYAIEVAREAAEFQEISCGTAD